MSALVRSATGTQWLAAFVALVAGILLIEGVSNYAMRGLLVIAVLRAGVAVGRSEK